MNEVPKINSTRCNPANRGLVTSVRDFYTMMQDMDNEKHTHHPVTGAIEPQVLAFQQRVDAMIRESTFVAPANACDERLCFSTAKLLEVCASPGGAPPGPGEGAGEAPGEALGEAQGEGTGEGSQGS